MRPFFLFLASSSTLLAVTPSSLHAETFCDSLQLVINEAGEHFTALRGAFDFYLDEYAGTVQLPPLEECTTDTDAGVAEYRCQLRGLPDNKAETETIIRKLGSLVENCLGKEIKLKQRARGDAIYYDYLPTNDEITIRYSRIVPRNNKKAPSHVVTLEVTFIDISK